MHSNRDNPTINKSTATLRIAIDASIKATNSSIIDTDRHVIIAVHRDFVALHRCKVSVHRRKGDRKSLRIRSLQRALILHRYIESLHRCKNVLLRCEASLQINIVTLHRCEACLHRNSETDSSNFITSAFISVRKHRYIVTDSHCFVPDASDIGTDTSFFVTKSRNTQRQRGCAVQPLHGSPSTINDYNKLGDF